MVFSNSRQGNLVFVASAGMICTGPGYFSNAFNPGQLARLRRFFLLEMELDLIAGKLSELK